MNTGSVVEFRYFLSSDRCVELRAHLLTSGSLGESVYRVAVMVGPGGSSAVAGQGGGRAGGSSIIAGGSPIRGRFEIGSSGAAAKYVRRCGDSPGGVAPGDVSPAVVRPLVIQSVIEYRCFF